MTPSHAERARTIVAARGEGALSTLLEGHPFGSLVIYAAVGPSPVFLISKLAEHTKNLEADPRASLLVAEEGAGETLARGRVTLVGTCRRVDDRARVEQPFLDRHPSAQRYAGFADFSFWELAVESARYVGGFGRMSWIDAGAWRDAEVDPLLDSAPSILAHMNEDHADACLAYARTFGGIADATSARMVAIDRYGFDVEAGDRTARVPFAAPLASADEVRKTLIAMVREARERA